MYDLWTFYEKFSKVENREQIPEGQIRWFILWYPFAILLRSLEGKILHSFVLIFVIDMLFLNYKKQIYKWMKHQFFPRLSKKLFGEDYAAIKKSNYPLQYFSFCYFCHPFCVHLWSELNPKHGEAPHVVWFPHNACSRIYLTGLARKNHLQLWKKEQYLKKTYKTHKVSEWR